MIDRENHEPEKNVAVGDRSVPVIYIPMDCIHYEAELVNNQLGIISRESKAAGGNNITYGIPKHLHGVDYVFDLTRGQERIIIAHPDLHYEENGRVEKENIVDRLKDSLNGRTRLIFLSNNGDGEEFRNSLSIEKRDSVKIIPKLSENLSIDGLRELIF